VPADGVSDPADDVDQAGRMTSAKQAVSKGPLHSAIELVVTVAVAIGLALLIQAFIVKPYKIPSTSMLPTLIIGQRVLANRLDTSPGLYDVVVFHPPHGADNSADPVCGNNLQGESNDIPLKQPCDQPTKAESSQTFIKRVVGLPGDVLQINKGHVIRNGKLEQDSFIEPCGGAPTCTFPGKIKVPAGDYYMMGDNRGGSDDSRFWGPVPQKWIIGVAFFTYWPPDRIGTL
jgi:signal peptidase I